MKAIKSVGFAISDKENERRRAILPEDVRSVCGKGLVVIQKGYGEVLGMTDEDYERSGASVGTLEEVLSCDLVVDPKIGDAGYLPRLPEGTAVFGWVHATQNRDITDTLIERKATAFAWEKMFEGGRHVFWRNNELAGEAAVMHAFQCYGRMPYESKVAVIGRGNTARGAIKVLNMLGAEVECFDRRTEGLLREEIGRFDVVVNCVLWDLSRTDHIISRADLSRMKRGSMIVDVSCDRGGGIESCIPTTIKDPVDKDEGVLQYAVDPTPTSFYKTFSHENSRMMPRYLSELLSGDISEVLKGCLILENGEIVDPEINEFQGRKQEVLPQ